MRLLLRWLLILVLVGGVAAAVAVPTYQWWRKASEPHYTTAAVSRGRVESVVNSTGTVKPVRTVTVGSFVSGPIAKVYVDYNSEVKKGDLLAEIDPRLLSPVVDRDQAALKTAEAEKARVEALLKQAVRNEERARKLAEVDKRYLSEAEMDQFHFNRLSLEAQLEFAAASITQAKATLKNSQANLEYTKIISPVDGIVIERKVDPGQTVASSFQTPELFIVAPDMKKSMHVYASVDEADIGRIREAEQQKKPVKFTVDAYPEEVFPGFIFQVRKNSSTNQNVVTYPVIIEAENQQLKLMPGMTASISFQIEVKEDVLRVPSAALRFVPQLARVRPEDRKYLDGTTTTGSADGTSGVRMSANQKAELAKRRSKRVVWVQDGELLRAVPVTLGLTDNQHAELLDGDLSEGQELVTGTEILVPSGR
jgi:HlyD family secretion protein